MFRTGRRKPHDPETVSTLNFRERRIDALFEDLRNVGFATAEGRDCCGGCTASRLEAETEPGTPRAWYHEQDSEGFETDGRLYVGYGLTGSTDEDEIREVGRKISSRANKLGIPTVWNGDPAVRILLFPSEA